VRDVAAIIRRCRLEAGLSKRELARRAGTSPAAIVAYENGSRSPALATLERVISATGHRLELVVTAEPTRPDPAIAGRRLVEVLELAEHLPHRPASRRVLFPPFPR
jgi:transcriptional regulator with XRE-family HTH domain